MDLVNIGDMVTSREAATLTGYSGEYVRMLARDGRVKCQKWGGRWMFDRADLLRHKADMAKLGTLKHSKTRGSDDTGN